MKTTTDDRVEAPRQRAAFDQVLRAVAHAPSMRPADIDLVGRTVGRFVVERRLGEGGMGVVYEAFDPVLARKVALKVLRASQRGSAVTRARLHEEARRVAAVHHPHIATVYDAGEHDGIVFLALERVAGRSLRARLAEPPPLSLPRAIAVLRAVAAGLSCAHAAGIVHRDLKPENVVVGDDGTVKIVDFGIATLSGDGVSTSRAARPAGTRKYMAPEQAEGAPASARADIFAFGVLAREVLAATFVRACDRSLRSALERLAGECVARDPEQRPEGGAAVLAAIDSITSPRSRSPHLAGVLALSAAALAGALGVSLARPLPDGSGAPFAERAPAAAGARSAQPGAVRGRAVQAAVRDRPVQALAPDRPNWTVQALAPDRPGWAAPEAAPEPLSARGLPTEAHLAAGASAAAAAGDPPVTDLPPALYVTAFVDADGHLVATVPLGAVPMPVLGFARKLTPGGAVPTPRAQAEIVADGDGGTVIHLTFHLRPSSPGSTSSGTPTSDPVTLPLGGASATGRGVVPHPPVSKGVHPSSAQPSVVPILQVREKIVELWVPFGPSDLRITTDANGRIHILHVSDDEATDEATDDDIAASLVALIDVDGAFIDLDRPSGARMVNRVQHISIDG